MKKVHQKKADKIQGGLFDGIPLTISPKIEPIKEVKYAKSESLADRFDRFHRANPAVYRTIRSIAFDLKSHGIHEFGIAAIFERMRWLYSIQTIGDTYKLNNSYRAFYARLLMKNEPQLRDFFETRVQTSESVN